MSKLPNLMLSLHSQVLPVDDLFVVEVAQSVYQLVNEVLGLGDCQSLPFLYQIEHVLSQVVFTPFVQI